MRIAKFALAAAMVMSAALVYAYVPENTDENSYQQRVEGPFFDVSALIDDGIKAVNQNVVSSTYANARGTSLGNNGLAEGEAGKEEVTSKDVTSYEPKEEIYEAKENMEEIIIWLTMYRIANPGDAVTYNKMKEYVREKQKYLDNLVDALKYEKDNKDAVLKAKFKIKQLDKDYKRYAQRLKGKIVLIQGKPLPEPRDDKQ